MGSLIFKNKLYYKDDNGTYGIKGKLKRNINGIIIEDLGSEAWNSFSEGKILFNLIQRYILRNFQEVPEKLKTILLTSRVVNDDQIAYNETISLQNPRVFNLYKYIEKIDHDFNTRTPYPTKDKILNILKDNIKYEYKISRKVQKVYDTKDFGSCMFEEPVTSWYNSRDNVKIVKIVNNDELIGRVLLWTADSGERILDRTYPENINEKAVHQWAKSRGWLYRIANDKLCSRLNKDIQLFITIEKSNNNKYPFLDTFYFVKDLGDRLLLSNKPHEGDNLYMRNPHTYTLRDYDEYHD